jgi:hypothetical protein
MENPEVNSKQKFKIQNSRFKIQGSKSINRKEHKEGAKVTKK